MSTKDSIKNISSIVLMVLALLFVVSFVIGEWVAGSIVGAVGAIVWLVDR